MIVDRAPLDDVRRAAHAAGMTTLSDAGWQLAAQGATSTAEVGRVVGIGADT